MEVVLKGPHSATAWARAVDPSLPMDRVTATVRFRGYDGIRAIAHAIEKAGSADPAAITKAFWSVDFVGLNGPIRFAKAGPAGKESGQSKPDVYLIEIKDGKVIVPAL